MSRTRASRAERASPKCRFRAASRSSCFLASERRCEPAGGGRWRVSSPAQPDQRVPSFCRVTFEFKVLLHGLDVGPCERVVEDLNSRLEFRCATALARGRFGCRHPQSRLCRCSCRHCAQAWRTAELSRNTHKLDECLGEEGSERVDSPVDRDTKSEKRDRALVSGVSVRGARVCVSSIAGRGGERDRHKVT